MELVIFEAVKNQLADRGYLPDQLEHGAWDTYENWKDRGRRGIPTSDRVATK